MIFLFENSCKVVNIKKEEYDVYIGRGSPFGNPYRIGVDGTRDEVIEKYKKYFYSRLECDIVFKCMVQELRNKVLGCHCKLKNCHCDIIKEYVEKL